MSEMTLGSILVAVDGSPHSERALEWAIDLAKRYGAGLTIVSVIPLLAPAYGGIGYLPQTVVESQSNYFRDVAEHAGAQARAAGIGSVTVELAEGGVAEAILDYLSAHPSDLVVMGSRGLGIGARVLMGSVSDAVVHHSSCPVLVVRSPHERLVAAPKAKPL
ncbi:MAG: universal stress protein [Thermoplasmata archaeon]